MEMELGYFVVDGELFLCITKIFGSVSVGGGSYPYIYQHEMTSHVIIQLFYVTPPYPLLWALLLHWCLFLQAYATCAHFLVCQLWNNSIPEFSETE
jgi:hypothetical protein